MPFTTTRTAQFASTGAARTTRLDWLGAIELRTNESPLGEVQPGEIVVAENHRVFAGIYATRKVCLVAPLLFLYGLALYFPPLRNLVGGSNPGRNGDACKA